MTYSPKIINETYRISQGMGTGRNKFQIDILICGEKITAEGAFT